MERHSGGGGPPAHLRGRPVSGLEAAHANEYFEPFLNAATLKNILGYHRAMCDLLHLRPNVFPHFYPKLRANLTSWRAKALWKKFDARASHKCYGKGKACAGLRVLVIGAGPCGLRTAIEAQLLGAKVVVVEKRDRLSRNNVLHLWPFVIEDLRMLGAKKFFGKFCAGAIDHISIRQLQCILLKVALLLGVEIHTEVSFEGLIEPSAAEKTGWRGQFKPEQHPVSQYEFDVIIGADGKRNTLQGFKRKEFRGKLAIAITANFINKKTEAEARVEEISGVAFIFNQKFFKELQEKTRIDLENIVYYKDDTHYFVMTAKKASLLEKGVIKQDLADTEKLLALANVDQERLHSYAREAADFSTNYKLPHLEFAVNHYGTPDVAMFDFTSMYAADYASKVVERNGTRLLMILVGDSLLEPFWPTGSGCARGFLSSLDAAWAIRSYCSGQMTPLDVLAERESIYRLLAQTTPDNLNKDWKAYTLDPATRYPNLNKRVVTPHQTVFLYDTDNPEGIDRMKRASLDYMGRPEHVAKKRRRGNVDSEVLLSWLSEQLKTHEEIEISDVKSVFENGRVLCALIHHYRPDLLDYGAIKEWEASRCNQLAMDVLEKELGLSPFMTGEEITRTNDYLVMTAYLTQVYDTFRGEIPHIKHPKLAVLSKIPQKFSEKSPKSGCKDDSYPLVHKTGEKVVKKRPKVPKIAINPPLQTLSERTVLPRNVGSLKSVKKREFFDLTYNAEVPREHKPKKVSSRNVCLSVNLLEKKPPKPKKKLIKKAKLAAIPEKTEEKCPQNPELTPKKTLNVFHCHTFITTKDSFESLGFPDVPVRIPYQDTQNPLEIPSKTPLENKNSTSKPQLGLKRFSPLELIRKHLRIKKARIEEVLNKTEVPPAEPEVIEKTSSVCSSQETINIEIIHAGNDDITRQNVFYESSKRLVKITSRNFVSKETMTRKDGSFVVQKIFENDNFQNFSGSKGASSNGRLEARRFPGFKRKPLVESTPHLNKHQTAVKPSRHCQTCQIRENFQENNNRVYEGHSGDMPGNDGDKIAKRSKTMTFRETDGDIFSPQVYGRVQNWIRRHDFQEGDHEPNFDEPTALASCKTRSTEYDGVKVEQRTEVIKCMEENSSHEDLRDLVKPAKRASKLKIPKQRSRGSNVPKPVSKYSQFNLKSQSAPPVEFAVIMEGNEPELPENVTKPSEFSIKSIKTHQPPLFPITTGPPSRPSSRHKRHADLIQTKPGSLDRKQRKKRATLERTGPSVEERQKVLEEIACNRQDRQSRRKQQRQRQTEQFLKSMQMLQANCRPDDESSGPFEDYSIFLYRQTAPKFQDRVKDLEKQFTYVPDHESKLPGGPKPLTNTNAEEDIASKIKSLQDKWSNKHPTEKKPKDLMRAIGKIETSDWNIQQIEKKIIENKIGKPSTLNADKERVPRWSKEEFLARQTKMEKKHLDRQDSTEAKYADIDRNIKQLDLKLKEGMNRELGQNKVATITEKLVSKVPQEKEKLVEKPVPAKPVNIQSGSEFCHFCNKRVYLMERLSAEGRFFHHGCFKCQYCHSQLRLGSYMFDRDGQYGYRFFCIHHYGMQGELPRPTKLTRKPSQKGENPRTSPQFPYNSQAVSGREVGQSPQKKPFGVTGVDLLDRVQTPERIEVSNLSSGNVSSDHEDHPSQMDEDEWTDKNFGQSCNELDESDDDDDSTSSVSDTDSDDEAAFDDALEQPVTKEGTMKWAERWKNSYRKGRGSDSDGYSSSDHSSYCENSSDESDSDTATEGEDEIRARELRKQEVRVDPPVVQTDTGTDTEMLSDESSSDTSSEIQNSATEISTDSEFAQDDPTPTRELPHITLNDFHVTKTRGSGTQPPLKCIQITSGYIQETSRPREHLELKLTPRKPLDGYALNRTQSTGGIAAKVSLELKKKYLLGENGPNTIQKSGSASTLDTKFKSFQSTITDCQKLLRPASEVFSKPPQMPPPLPPPPDITITALPEPKGEENDGQGRPRSPVHETSIPVPSIDWSKGRHSQSSDSLGTSSSENESPNFEIPRLEVHEVKEEVVEVEEEQKKSVTSEKKSLNEPKSLPEVDEGGLEEVHRVLHARREEEAVGEAEKSSPDQPLTETELSDWARDENASDSIEIEPQKPTQVPQDRPFNPTPPTINLDSIEFMDTGTSSCEENHRARNDGYVQFKDEEDSEDPPPPLVNEIFEARNAFVAGGFGGHVTDLKPSDLELLKLKQAQTEHEEDSLLVLETTNNTTTEENTCTTDSTVKHVTEMAPSQKIESLQKQRLEDKLAKVKAELYNNEQYEEHCQRLQSKVEFGNAKDSIDVRKSRRRSKQDDAPPQPPDLIQEERHVTLMQLTSPPSTPIRPDVLYNKENIKKERDVNKKLIEDMVMNKMRAENKSLERKRRNRNVGGLSPSRPDLLRPLSVFNAETAPNEAEETPRAPPRYNRPSDVAKTAEKMKENARARARLLSNEDLGLSPEDKLNRLREKLRSQPGEGERGKKNGPPENLSQLEPHTDCKKRSDSFRRSKSTGERPKSVPKLSTVAPKSEEKRENHEDKKKKFCKSDPNLLDTSKKKSERRKSLTKLIAGIFTKGNLLAKLSPKAKTGSKSLTSLDYLRHESVSAPPTKTRSETHLPPRRPRESTPPPPVPPLPANYVPKDESSDGEPPHQGGGGSCDTLDRSGTTTARGGRSGKARKVSRQAQLKRHRMAQEIQRKLEETEVKTRELESRGVEVEKALRGEDNGRCKRDEGELLQEWFDLMRDRTELRRYEKELMVRAQELELEDRHARLQGELRERLENSESFNSIIFVALRSE
ncbi:F-actin-monooxygenase MICAL2 isoform X2 [Anthonomus grandis grandis]|uniref:F-actin-monooxygenase MICAL2 isoform X2 n=1 Tax=Anthonomus grandis grandis TaxID=2921223 RepID=UPI002165E4A5|nr:F-actin-monooxygenase MICAL2 isoform X2 [Anthonomus grandis grandis]